MRKANKRNKRNGMHPVLKAQIRAKWNATAVEASIHAFIGGDKQTLMAYASVLFFVAGGCAAQRGWTGDEPDFRIVRGSINALDDLKDRKEIADIDRASLHAGMLAAQRIIADTPVEMVDAAAYTYAVHSAEWGQPA
jgi:hypothetical protein